MWETASPQQRDWLKVQCDAIGYDYSYLDQPPSPPARQEVRRSSSAKQITTATLASLDTSWAALEIRHAHPDAMHVLMPREPNEPRFRPAEPSISEYNCLLRMLDGETILVHLRFPTGVFDALPARSRTLCRSETGSGGLTCGSVRCQSVCWRQADWHDRVVRVLD